MASAGKMPNPFTNYEDYQEFRRVTKKRKERDWDYKGWRHPPKKPKMGTYISSEGNEYKMPESDYDEYMTYYRSQSEESLSDGYSKSGRSRDIKTPADYVDYAFGKNTKAVVVTQKGCGHIKMLWYSAYYQILKVKFWNGTICAFFRVPKEVAGVLLALAQTGTTMHTENGERHMLGVYFWDLVRIRRTVHGSRYKFVYTDDRNTGGLPGRPYGSGEYLYRAEQGPARNVQKAIDTKQKAIDMLDKDINGMKYILSDERLKRIIVESGKYTAEQLVEAAAIAADNKQTLLKDIEALEALPPVQRYTKVLNVSDAPDDLKVARGDIAGNDPTVGRYTIMENYDGNLIRVWQPLSIDQRMQMHMANSAESQRQHIAEHNAAREAQRRWTIDRIDDLVDKLAEKNMLGRGGIDAFYRKFKHAEEQFDYLKARGFITPGAKFYRGED